MMDRRRSRIAYLLPLVLLLAAGADARRISAFDGTDERYRAFAGRIEIFLMKGLVSERHLPHAKNGRLPEPILGCIRPRWHAGKLELQVEDRWTIVRGGDGRENSHPPSTGNYGIQPRAREEFDQRRMGHRKIEGGRRGGRSRRVRFGASRHLRYLRRSQGNIGSCPLAAGDSLVLVTSRHHTERVRHLLLLFRCGQRV